MSGYTYVGPLTYRGKSGCDSIICTREYNPKTKTLAKDCYGWHCTYCDEPCSYQGHRCDAADAILGEARRQIQVKKDRDA